MKTLAIIPARYASTRFPGKPLALIAGKPMIQWVWEGVRQIGIINDAVVATDDERIYEAVKSFGGQVLMTSSNHRSGTDRCGEVLTKLGSDADVVINVQGDEPKVEHTQIELVASCFADPKVQIATLKKEITTQEELFSPNCVKVIEGNDGNAIYFSRNPIPYLRGKEKEEWLTHRKFYKHIGVYAFRREVLQEVVKLQQTPLEVSESLEQLRWLENGYRIAVRETNAENIGIDTPEDLERLNASLR
ncbi:MAG: 3-deoxy-manno-octulosonate cytidylyltransferase [Bacteroidales bacterium]|nr:3-deoxy-manno-octulosonate cytidylyltransferase [Bacteroidales bacterium]